MSVNKAIIMGRVGKDPETKELPNGSKVANFSVATSESWKDKQTGEKKEKTEWHRVTVWGDGLVDALGKYLRSGNVVLVEGQIETREYEKDGSKRYTTEIIVKSFGHKVEWFETVKREGGQRETPPNAGGASGGGIDDDIPF